MHEDIWHFLYKIRKGQILSQTMKDKMKDCTAKFLCELKHPPPTKHVFLSLKNFCNDINKNQTLSLQHRDCDANRLNMEVYINFTQKIVLTLIKTLYLVAKHYAIAHKQENPMSDYLTPEIAITLIIWCG